MQSNGTTSNSPSEWQTMPAIQSEVLIPSQLHVLHPAIEVGAVIVADRVVAEIVGRSVAEVVGDVALVSPSRTSLLAWLRRVLGRDTGIPGVDIAVGRGAVSIRLTILVTYGASIPQVVDSLRRYVTARVETLTGLRVRDVRVAVVGLAEPDDPPAPDRRAPAGE